MNVSNRLKQLRKERGFSQYSLSKKSNVSQAFISSIEKGKKSPTVNSLEKLCKALGVSLAEFFSKEIKAPPEYMEPLIEEARYLKPKHINLLADLLAGFRMWD